MCLPQQLQEHKKDADRATIILEINITLNVTENLGKVRKSKQKILVIEKQAVYGARFVNNYLQIFMLVQVEEKLPIYFPLFPSMIKSSIYTNGLT